MGTRAYDYLYLRSLIRGCARDRFGAYNITLRYAVGRGLLNRIGEAGVLDHAYGFFPIMIYDIWNFQKPFLVVYCFSGANEFDDDLASLIAYGLAAPGFGILREDYAVFVLEIDLKCDLEVIYFFIVFIVYDILVVSADEIIDCDLHGIGKQILEKIAV